MEVRAAAQLLEALAIKIHCQEMSSRVLMEKRSDTSGLARLENLWWPFLVATEIISDHEDQWESNFIIKFTSLLDQWEEFDIVTVHWVIAITYFEAALKTPSLLQVHRQVPNKLSRSLKESTI